MSGRKGRAHRSYSAQIRAKALAVLQSVGWNCERASMELDIPRVTLRDWAHRYGPAPSVVDEAARQDFDALRAKELAELREGWAEVVRLGLPSLRAKVAEGTGSAQQLAYALGVAFDKVRLIDNKPTAITAETDLATFLGRTGYAEVTPNLHVVERDSA